MPAPISSRSSISFSISMSSSRRIRSSRSSSSMTSINCLWFGLLLCHSCNIFGLLEQHLVEALPFEYLDEHLDDFNYDLDEAQSQAKYDARLLSEQMLSDAELQQRADSESGISYSSNSNKKDNKNNNGDNNSNNFNANSNSDLAEAEDDLEPHSRAAACFTNGHKYTHGQKVPRSDACEVCLCMDGEIFCWWEKCDKANANRAETATVLASTSTVTAATAAVAGDYSDPYRYETTSRKPTKVHKTGRRRKHRKNQKNFNDYEVYQSRKQAPDYEKPDVKQKQQQQVEQQQHQKGDNIGNRNAEASNYNIIKQHKHDQKLATATLEQQQPKEQMPPLQQPQQQQEQVHLAAVAVNQAAKETHYQQQLPAPQQQHQQQQQHPHQQQQQQQHLHAHQQQPPHSSSKILNFPENLPALLYYDYKTEEHEHHQHQHHQQHLLHEKQRLQQQQQLLRQQQQKILQKASAVVEPSSDLGIDKNFDEAETDSDILPEPPTKRPVATAALTTSSTNSSSSISISSNASNSDSSKATTMAAAVATTIEMMTTPATAVAMPNTNEIEEADDAFHRWLTSTELNVDSTNTLDDGFGVAAATGGATAAGVRGGGGGGGGAAVAAEQETPASTIIDDVGINKANGSKDNGNARHGSSIADNADAVFFRSSYNDYSSEFNGSVVNIDITLTAVDVHPQRPHQQQQQQQQQQQLAKAAASSQMDLIANDNQTSDVHARQQTAGQPTTATATATATTIAATTTSQSDSSSNQHLPPYTLTTIITTTPLATGRMCNVLGKLYKIGEILPQDTGNCLQCICTDAVTPDELPSVTCSPHNCPPLVLPDLFDATGY